jgi:hypothetical protein
MEASLLAARVAISSPEYVFIVAIIPQGLEQTALAVDCSLVVALLSFLVLTGWLICAGRYMSCLHPSYCRWGYFPWGRIFWPWPVLMPVLLSGC